MKDCNKLHWKYNRDLDKSQLVTAYSVWLADKSVHIVTKQNVTKRIVNNSEILSREETRNNNWKQIKGNLVGLTYLILSRNPEITQ